MSIFLSIIFLVVFIHNVFAFSCGDTIPANTVETLTEDIICEHGIGLILESNAKLNMNTFAIICSNCAAIGSDAGIVLTGSNIRIVGPGHIKNFGYGIRDNTSPATNNKISRLVLSGNYLAGIQINNQTTSYVIKNVIAINNGNGFLIAGKQHYITQSAAYNNYYGFKVCGDPYSPNMYIWHYITQPRAFNNHVGFVFCDDAGSSSLNGGIFINNIIDLIDNSQSVNYYYRIYCEQTLDNNTVISCKEKYGY